MHYQEGKVKEDLLLFWRFCILYPMNAPSAILKSVNTMPYNEWWSLSRVVMADACEEEGFNDLAIWLRYSCKQMNYLLPIPGLPRRTIRLCGYNVAQRQPRQTFRLEMWRCGLLVGQMDHYFDTEVRYTQPFVVNAAKFGSLAIRVDLTNKPDLMLNVELYLTRRYDVRQHSVRTHYVLYSLAKCESYMRKELIRECKRHGVDIRAAR